MAQTHDTHAHGKEHEEKHAGPSENFLAASLIGVLVGRPHLSAEQAATATYEMAQAMADEPQKAKERKEAEKKAADEQKKAAAAAA